MCIVLRPFAGFSSTLFIRSFVHSFFLLTIRVGVLKYPDICMCKQFLHRHCRSHQLLSLQIFAFLLKYSVIKFNYWACLCLYVTLAHQHYKMKKKPHNFHTLNNCRGDGVITTGFMRNIFVWKTVRDAQMIVWGITAWAKKESSDKRTHFTLFST